MKIIFGFIVVALLAGIVPFGLIALARSQPSPLPPVHPQQDLFKQVKFRSQHINPMFADGRAMRPRLDDVEARGDLEIHNEIVDDPDRPHMIYGGRDKPRELQQPPELNDELAYQRFTQGSEPQADGKPGYVKEFPLELSADLLERGRQRYTINCAVCHGQAGYGDGTVAQRAAEIQAAGGDAAGWIQPKNLHSADLLKQPVGQIFNTITNGARTMPSYAKQVSVLDRWAIVAYVKALQRSQDAKAEDVPKAEEGKYK